MLATYKSMADGHIKDGHDVVGVDKVVVVVVHHYSENCITQYSSYIRLTNSDHIGHASPYEGRCVIKGHLRSPLGRAPALPFFGDYILMSTRLDAERPILAW